MLCLVLPEENRAPPTEHCMNAYLFTLFGQSLISLQILNKPMKEK
jgi:hypothetical protein